MTDSYIYKDELTKYFVKQANFSNIKALVHFLILGAVSEKKDAHATLNIFISSSIIFKSTVLLVKLTKKKERNFMIDVSVREAVEVAYKQGLTYKEISEQFSVIPRTIKYWKNKYDWKRDAKPKDKSKQSNKVGAPKGNTNNLKHGRYVKSGLKIDSRLVKEIVGEIVSENLSVAEMLWQNIVLQFAMILSSQKILRVKDTDEVERVLTKKIVKKSKDGFSIEKAYKISYPWQKYMYIMQMQGDAALTLFKLIRQYEKITRSTTCLEIGEIRSRFNEIKSKLKEEIATENHETSDMKVNSDANQLISLKELSIDYSNIKEKAKGKRLNKVLSNRRISCVFTQNDLLPKDK